MELYEIEPNNLRTNATEMYAGDTMYGYISSSDDMDCFAVVFKRNVNVTVNLDVPSGMDYRLRVFKNSVVAPIAEDVRTGYYGQTRTCAFDVASTSDTYYIMVSFNSSKLYDAGNAYSLNVFYTDGIEEDKNTVVTDYITEAITALGITNATSTTNSNNKYWNEGTTNDEGSRFDWNLTTTPCGTSCSSNYFGNASQCAGFSLFLANRIFGDYINMSKIYNNSLPTGWSKIVSDYTNVKLKPGDIVRKNGHSVMVWKIESVENEDGDIINNVYVIECLGGVSCLVRYGGYNGHTAPGTMSDLLSGSIEYILISPEKRDAVI